MASTYSQNLKIELMGSGDQVGSWGETTNDNLGTTIEEAIVGYGAVQFTNDANLTLTLTNSNDSQTARKFFLYVTSTVSLSAQRDLIVPTIEKTYTVHNNTTGGQAIRVKTSAGTGVVVPSGKKMILYANGTNVIEQMDYATSLTIGTLNIDSPLPVASGGTGASTATNARTNLGLGTIATQSASSVAITGGSITGLTNLSTSGSVGVGTSSPGYTLDVDSASATFRVRDSSAGNDFGIKNITGPVSVAGSRANTAIGFMTNDIERMRIDTAGNVGIGTSSPEGYRLNVNGNYACSSLADITPNALFTSQFVINGNGYSAGIALDTTAMWFGHNSNNRSLIFVGGNNGTTVTERMRIDTSGNLLVGTTSSTGSLTNTTKFVPGVASSYNGTVSAATGTTVTMFVVPTPSNGATFLVTVTLTAPDSGANYTVLGLLRCGSTTTSYTNILTAANLTVSLSGTNLQVNQTSGATQNVQWSLLRLV